MGPGVGAQRGGSLCQEDIIMTALAPLESRHPRLGQSLWWLWVMRPRCLHAHAAPAGVLVCPAGRPGEVPLPSVTSSPCVCVMESPARASSLLYYTLGLRAVGNDGRWSNHPHDADLMPDELSPDQYRAQ